VEADINQKMRVAIAAHKEGKFEEAEQLYNEILEIQSTHPDANHNLGVLKVSLGLITEALVLFKTAIENNPNPEQFWISYINTLIKENKLEEAEINCRNAVKLKPNFTGAYNSLAIVLYKIKKLDEAEKIFKKVIKLKPDLIEAHNNLGKVLTELNRLKEAEIIIKKTIELKPDNAEAYNNLGNLQKILVKLEEAEKSFKKAIELKPNFLNAHFNLGVIFLVTEKYQKAINCFEKTIKIDPNYINAYNNLGYSYGTLKKYGEAIEKYSKLLKLEPKNLEARVNIITILENFTPTKINSNPIIIANDNIKNIKVNFSLENGINKFDLSNFFKDANKVIENNIKELNFNRSQIFRRNSINLNCDRHHKVFNKLDLIPEFCFSCFKIQIEPKNVFELFKLFFIFDKLKLPQNNTRKCMIEFRPGVSGFYKGFIYCSSTREADMISKMISPIINKLVIGKIKIKRGCSEFSDKFPDYKEINKDNNVFMKYKDEWRQKEKSFDMLDNTIIKKSSISLSGISVSDILIMNNWLNYAKQINDLSYKDISEEMIYSDYITSELSGQLNIRKKEFY
jgi:tetratricopeptide (TPR) repeat protein|tara:strand:+ start:51 stop:1751 length:1701 start_codon:yes stop_codon:yes gene_type:complete